MRGSLLGAPYWAALNAYSNTLIIARIAAIRIGGAPDPAAYEGRTLGGRKAGPGSIARRRWPRRRYAGPSDAAAPAGGARRTRRRETRRASEARGWRAGAGVAGRSW
jgi:hypothetical protein